MGSRQITALTLAVCFLVLAAALPAQRANITERTRTGSIRQHDDVTVREDGLDGVKARQNRGSISIKAESVVKLQWIQVPDAYEKGLGAFNNGDYAGAAPHFTASLENARSYAWLPVYANWYLAESLRRQGDAEGALAAYAAMLKANARCRQAPDAYVAMSDIYLQTGRTAEARKALQDLGKVAGSDERFKNLVQLGLGQIELQAGDLAKAKSIFEALVRSAARFPSIANQARLGIGNVLVKQKDFGGAEKHFERILASGGKDAEIIAGASNGLGDCQYHQKNYEKAMYTYSKVYTMFLDDPAQAEQVGHALYFGGRSFRLQAGSETDAKKKALLLKHGKDVLRKADKEFRHTAGGRAAKNEI